MKLRGRNTLLLATILLTLVAACSGAREYGLSPARTLAGFRESSPLIAELTAYAAAVAVFVGVEGTEAGCAHSGSLLLPDGEQQPIVLRCLEAPRAPGGSSYHQLVVLRDPAHVDALGTAPLDLSGFAHLTPLDEAGDDHEQAPGWIVTTRRPQLLFGDQAVPQQLEK